MFEAVVISEPDLARAHLSTAVEYLQKLLDWADFPEAQRPLADAVKSRTGESSEHLVLGGEQAEAAMTIIERQADRMGVLSTPFFLEQSAGFRSEIAAFRTSIGANNRS